MAALFCLPFFYLMLPLKSFWSLWILAEASLMGVKNSDVPWAERKCEEWNLPANITPKLQHQESQNKILAHIVQSHLKLSEL
jgi:hypothetical protein